MDFLIITMLSIPLATFGLLWIVKNKKIINAINITASILLLINVFIIVGEVVQHKKMEPKFLYNAFYIDSLNSILLIVTSVIGFLVSIYSISYMTHELNKKLISIRKYRIFFCLLHGFIFTMLLAEIAQNMGLLWIAIEATTLASAFLVGFYNNKKSIEAAWKYIIICSVGIAFALMGIVLLYYSSTQSLGNTVNGLNWLYLFKHAGSLQGGILKLSFLFILVGFGTKAGLVPMHTWLPDAHSQAPSPISAMLSGVLLNTAMYGILRVMIIVNKSLHNTSYTGNLLVFFGLASIGIASVFILVQHDFKRLLAYSSIEHMGIIAFGIGTFSPLSIFGALFHVMNHSFTKSMLFIASGNIYLKYDTKKINKIQGILKIMPITGAAFLIGMFAITGMPPFSIFSSELNVIVSAFNKNDFLGAGLMLIFLALIFGGFISQLIKMFYGKPASKDIKKGEISVVGSAVLIVLVILISVSGLYLPEPLMTLLNSARNIVLGA
ncbi:MAG TPA: hydrogenase 4 subunit F [Clostridia bacterium]|nr:hydrogenase 4 subunit F [Clostridia bacterium]